MNKTVGAYRLSEHNCRLILRPGSGAHFEMTPKGKGLAEIYVGADQKKFLYLLENLYHEAMEFAMAEVGVRFENSSLFAFSGDRYHFSFNHPQFTEICSRAVNFVEDCRSDLRKAWIAWNKPKAKKRKRRK